MTRLLVILFATFLSGNITAQVVEIDVVQSTHSVFTSDMNGDGLTDVISCQFGDIIHYYEQTSIGVFAPREVITSPLLVSDLWGGIEILDIDADGDMDIFVIGAQDWTSPPPLPDDTQIALLINDGNANFTLGDSGFETQADWQQSDNFYLAFMPTLGQTMSAEPSIKFLASHGGNDGDVFIHELVAGNSNGELSALPPYHLASASDFMVLNPYFLSLVSAQMDTDTELESINFRHKFGLYDAGTDTYQTAPQGATLSMAGMCIDLDMDGDLDIVSFSLNDSTGQYENVEYINDGNGLLSLGSIFSGPIGLAVDLDDDGDEDIIDWKGRSHLNDGNGQFTTLAAPEFPNSNEFYLSPSFDPVPTVHLSDNPNDPSFTVVFNRDGDSPFPSGIAYVPVNVGCPQDIDNDGQVDVNDFLMYNSAFGSTCSGCPEDMTGDGVVDVNDFLELNTAYGTTCP